MTIFPVPIDMRDWSAKIPLNTPEAIRTLVEQLKSVSDYSTSDGSADHGIHAS